VLSTTRLLTFDCYGTLIDWAGGLMRSFRGVFGDSVESRRDEFFTTYVQIEAAFESPPYRSYRDVVTLTLEELARRLDLPLREADRDALARTLPSWTPFADTNEALNRLKRRFRVGVLSNIDRDLFNATARHFEVEFDFLICAQDVGSYKPALGHFHKLAEQEGGLDHVLHVAQSLFHDGAPAKQLGLAYAWINRYNERNATEVKPLAEFADLCSLADLAG